MGSSLKNHAIDHKSQEEVQYTNHGIRNETLEHFENEIWQEYWRHNDPRQINQIILLAMEFRPHDAGYPVRDRGVAFLIQMYDIRHPAAVQDYYKRGEIADQTRETFELGRSTRNDLQKQSSTNRAA